MGLGILDDRHMAAPPGTSTINDPGPEIDSKVDTSHFKRDGDTILQPQPSDSPNDPLNWSPLRKECLMWFLAFSSGVTTSLGPMVSPALPLLAEKYKVSIDMVASLLIGFVAFWIGFTTFFTAAGANVWGKRPFFVISTAVLLGTCVWGFFTGSFVSLAVMRVVQGIASAPLETLVTSTVSDMYFVHQRGARIAVWGCMLASGVLLGQTISGAIIQNISFEATFGVAAIVFVPIMFGMYFFALETSYYSERPSGEKKVAGDEKRTSFMEIEEDRVTYASQLALFRGRLSKESFWKNVWKPVPLIAFPAVLFSTIVYSTGFCWLLTFSVLSVNVFSAPPYKLNPLQIGLTNLPLLGVALISSPLSGWSADAIAKFMARRNKGVFEPEFRLALMIPATVFSTVGFLGFGMCVEQGLPLAWPMTFMAIHSLSVPFASTASLTYVIDCHPRDANQAFVTINFTKAVLTFIATTYASGILINYGPTATFNGIMMMNLGISAFTIPAYIFGKRFRSLVARSAFAQKLSG